MEYISYNMGNRDLPDIYTLALGPAALGLGYIYQANPSCPCYNLYIYIYIYIYIYTHTHMYTVEPAVYYGHLGTNQKCPDYQGVLIFQVNLHDKLIMYHLRPQLGDYAGVHMS